MKRFISALALLTFSGAVFSQEHATCKNPEGHSYFFQRGIVQAKESGWTKDKISSGILTLRKNGSEDYDILYVDATRQVHSTKGEGGVVKLLRAGENEMTFILFYPGSTIELYTFLQDDTGKGRLSILTSKGGDSLVPYKQSILVANCSAITFVKASN
jgi:hypothetical protein